MAPRFFSEEPIESDRVTLTGPEHQHLAKVLRLLPGDGVVLFDGNGGEFLATIQSVERQGTVLEIESIERINRESKFELTLAVALPKGDRQQWLVEKCVELGVTRLIPLKADRGVAQPNEKAMTRIHRWIVAASKQCGRNRLMDVTASKSIGEVLMLRPTFFAHPYGSDATLVDLIDSLQSSSAVVAVGPEGGFTDDEIEAAKRGGASQFGLGSRILRVETAAISIAATMVNFLG